MKSLRDYIAESEREYSQPVTGDYFSINIREETLLETWVCDETPDGIVLHADERVMQLLEDYGYISESNVAEGSLNEGQYEMRFSNGKVRKFIATDDADAKRIAKGHGATSVIKLKGGVPAGKVAEQDVTEGSSQAVSDITVKKIRDGGYDGLTQWHVFRGDEMIGYVNLNQEGFADGLYLAYGHGPGRAEREEFNGLKSAVKFIAGLREGVAEGDYQADSDGSDVDVIDRGEYDYEGDQARDQLRTIVRAARRLNGIIDDDDNLPEWVQMKITKATDYIDTAADYMQSNADQSMEEAKYQGREVPLGKPMAGDVKKSKVYVRGPKGNVVKVNFGQKGMKIKKNIPGRRKNFRARHNCDNPGPRWKARYWSCRAW